MKMPPLSDADLQQLLQRPLVARFATHGRNGGLRITPVWFKHADGEIVANTLERTDLARNLRKDPECSVLIDVDEQPDVVAAHFWGSASVEGPADAAGIADIIERYVGSREGALAFAARNLSMGAVVYIRFRPQRIVTWDLRQVDPR